MLAQVASIWLVVVELAIPNSRPIAIQPGYTTEAACHEAIARIARGEYNTLFLDNGGRLPIARGLGCISLQEPATS